MAWDDAFPTAASALETMAQWEAYWVGGLGGAAGVIASVGAELTPSINSGARTVSVGTGAALVRGFYSGNTSATYTTDVPTQSTGDRVDRLVLRLDRTAVTASDWVTPTIIQGTSGSSTPPALQTSSTGSWDLPLCRWTTKADGTLTDLVDERVYLGGSFVTFTSGARPVASVPRLGLETDTGRLLYADGSTWKTLVPDTGWLPLTITNSAWKPTLDCVGRALNGFATLRIGVQRVNSTFSKNDANGSPLLTVPSALHPAYSQFTTVQFSGGVATARVDVSATDNSVSFQHNSGDVTPGRTALFTITYALG